MYRWRFALAFGILATAVIGSAAARRAATSGESMTSAAQAFVETLNDDERKTVLLKYDTPKRLEWHFIPKDKRKGLQIRNMKDGQRKAALKLLRTGLSELGYNKAKQVMELEKVLADLEKSRQGGNIRDAQRYYYTIFGSPTEQGKWGLSIEGHHLSFNFVVEKNEVVSSTPTFYAANPATMMDEIVGVKKGLRVLADEEQLGFDLVNSLTADQKKVAVIAKKAPREIRGAGEAKTPADEKVGVAYDDLDDKQKEAMRKLVRAYAVNMPADVADQRIQSIVDAGTANVRFAWAGAMKPGVGHYYRIQGPTFLIEFVNTQPDPAGNLANHIHCVWRDTRGDFAIRD